MSNRDSKRTEAVQRQLRRDNRTADEVARPARPEAVTGSRSTDTYGCVDWFDYGQHDRQPHPAG